jgi:hypothetical protein
MTTVIISVEVDSEEATAVDDGAAVDAEDADVVEDITGVVGTTDELELFVSTIGVISGSFDMYDSEPVSFDTNTGEDTGEVST